jgi:hypothetical protein
MENASSEEICPGKLLRGFCLGSIFDFFNRIGQLQTSNRFAPPLKRLLSALLFLGVRSSMQA